jgi:hypothetical protein
LAYEIILCRVDRSDSVILEEILLSPSKQSSIVGLLGLKETILVADWYIWWQHRELVKGEITSNYGATIKATTPKVNA